MIVNVKNPHYPNGVEKFQWVVRILPRSVCQEIVCTTCLGQRMIVASPFDLDGGIRPCPICNGKGHLSVLNDITAPPELEAAMQKLLDEHLKEKP